MKAKEKYDFLCRFLIKTVAMVIALIVILTFIFRIYRMTGNTMSPYVRDGDFCVFYCLDNIYLNDVILYEDENGEKHVGRVVASGGQTIDFPEQGGYLVSDYQPTEENPYKTEAAEESMVEYPLILNEDEYFVLNDFRQLTADSREQGAIQKKQIKGKLLFLMRRRDF